MPPTASEIAASSSSVASVRLDLICAFSELLGVADVEVVVGARLDVMALAQQRL